MAKVQKGSKINFYKFVQVKSPPSSGASAKTESVQLAKSINNNTQAINNLGATVNSLASILKDLKKVSIVHYELEEKNKKKFKAEYNKPKKGGSGFTGFLSSLASEGGGFFEGLMKILGAAFKAAIVMPALRWISDPRNRKKLENIIGGIAKVLKFIAGWAAFGVTNTIEGLYTLLSDESSPWEKVGGLVRGLTGLGSILLGLRWLRNPTRLVTDFGNVLIFLYNNLVRGRRGLLGRAGALGLLAAGAYGGYKVYKYMKDGEKPTQVDEDDEPAPPEFAKGGKIDGKNLVTPDFKRGGLINGPQSGYPVSLDGGHTTAFIGHGTEKVLRKSDGGAFVIPLNTPATQRNPHLTAKRMQEATSMGFGSWPGILPRKDHQHMASGGNLDRQIYLHWTAGGYNHRGGPYHATVQGSGKIYRHLNYDQRTGHTYNRNSGNVGLSVAAMGGRAWRDAPPKDAQIDAMTLEAANIAKKWGWKPSDVNIKRVMTHAEAGSNKDGRRMHDNYGPVMWGGNGERWDWLQLKQGDKPGTGGDKLRQKIKKHMGDKNAKEVPEAGGITAADAYGGGDTVAARMDIPLTLSGTAKSLVGGDGNFLAEVNRVAKAVKAHPADLLGLMASESGLDPKAQNKSGATGLIQFMPDTAAGLGTSTSALKGMSRSEQMKYVEKFLKKTLHGVPVQGSHVSAGNLYTAVYLPAFAAKDSSYIVAKKGGFSDSWGHHPAAWYSHNSGLDLNGDGAITIAELGKRIADKKKEFGINGGTMTISTSGRGAVSPQDHEDGFSPAPRTSTFLGGFTEKKFEFGDKSIFTSGGLDKAAAQAQASRTGGSSPSRGGSSTRGGVSPSSGGASRVNRANGASESESQKIKEISEQRNDARRQINEKTSAMIKAALDAVGQQNGINAQMVMAAQKQIQSIASQSGGGNQPQFVPTGISGSGVGRAIGGSVGAAIGGTTAAILNSTNNPLKGIFR